MVRLEFITLGSHPLLILYQIICLDSEIDNLFRLIAPYPSHPRQVCHGGNFLVGEGMKFSSMYLLEQCGAHCSLNFVCYFLAPLAVYIQGEEQ